MESALEEIEFLALSANRVDVLGLLAEGRCSRSELAEATGASQATLGRILHDFEERSWIRRDEDAYVATATGRLVASGFTDLREILESEMRLRAVVDYLPTHAMDVDLRRLADATITLPSQMRPNAPLSRLLELLENGENVRTFSHAFNEQTLRIVEERTEAGEQRFGGVFSNSAIEALAGESNLRHRLRSLVDSDRADLRVRDEGVPIAAMIVDDVVYLLLRDENGVLQASLDTDDPAVRAWARDTYDHYWRTARPLDADSV